MTRMSHVSLISLKIIKLNYMNNNIYKSNMYNLLYHNYIGKLNDDIYNDNMIYKIKIEMIFTLIYLH